LLTSIDIIIFLFDLVSIWFSHKIKLNREINGEFSEGIALDHIGVVGQKQLLLREHERIRDAIILLVPVVEVCILAPDETC
jgi:hypothetical protein